MTICIENTINPADLRSIEILATKVKERHTITNRRHYVGDQRHDMRESHFTCIAGIDSTTFHTTRAFYHPEVFAQITAIDPNMELLCPEGKQLGKIIGICVGIAIVPAINHAQSLRAPVPT